MHSKSSPSRRVLLRRATANKASERQQKHEKTKPRLTVALTVCSRSERAERPASQPMSRLTTGGGGGGIGSAPPLPRPASDGDDNGGGRRCRGRPSAVDDLTVRRVVVKGGVFEENPLSLSFPLSRLPTTNYQSRRLYYFRPSLPFFCRSSPVAGCRYLVRGRRSTQRPANVGDRFEVVADSSNNMCRSNLRNSENASFRLQRLQRAHFRCTPFPRRTTVRA